MIRRGLTGVDLFATCVQSNVILVILTFEAAHCIAKISERPQLEFHRRAEYKVEVQNVLLSSGTL